MHFDHKINGEPYAVVHVFENPRIHTLYIYPFKGRWTGWRGPQKTG